MLISLLKFIDSRLATRTVFLLIVKCSPYSICTVFRYADGIYHVVVHVVVVTAKGIAVPSPLLVSACI